MRHYDLQAYAVQLKLDQTLESNRKMGFENSEIIYCLQDAITTLNAAALTKEKLAITEELIKIAQEFVMDAPSMDLTELICYQNDFRKILDKLK